MRKPVVTVWTSTNRCNLGCRFCFGKEDKKELGTADAKRLLERIRKDGAKHLVFSGGEPLLRKDIFELASYARKIGLKTILHTNGILVNGSNADAIAANFNTVNLPIDGAGEKANSMMGRGSLARTLEMLDAFAGRCEITVSTVATRMNAGEIPKIAALLENKKIRKWRIFQFNPKLGPARENAHAFAITAGDFEALGSGVRCKKAEFVAIGSGFEKNYHVVSSDGTT